MGRRFCRRNTSAEIGRYWGIGCRSRLGGQAVEFDAEFEDESGVGEEAHLSELDFFVVAFGEEGEAPDGREIAFAFVEKVVGAGDGDVVELGCGLKNLKGLEGVDEQAVGGDDLGLLVGDDAEFAEFDEAFLGGGGDAIGDGDGADVLIGGGVPVEEAPGGGREAAGAARAGDLHEVGAGGFGDHLIGEGSGLEGADLGVNFHWRCDGRFFSGDGFGRRQGDGRGLGLERQRCGLWRVGEGFAFDGEGAGGLKCGVGRGGVGNRGGGGDRLGGGRGGSGGLFVDEHGADDPDGDGEDDGEEEEVAELEFAAALVDFVGEPGVLGIDGGLGQAARPIGQESAERTGVLEGLEVVDQGEGVAVAIFLFLGHHLFADLGELGGDVGAERARVGRGREEDLADGVVGVGGGVGRRAGEAFVERGAEAVDVVLCVDILRVADLLGAHVGRRADGGSGLGELGLGGGEVLLGEAEVGELCVAAAVDHDVVGLDVAVDDLVLGGDDEGLRDVEDDAQCFGFGQGPLAQALGEGAAGDVLEDDVVEARGLVEVGVHDGDDIGVADAGSELGFADEALRDFGAFAGHDGRQDLERHVDLQRGVGGEVDGAHAAGAELADDLTSTDDIFRGELAKGSRVRTDPLGIGPLVGEVVLGFLGEIRSVANSHARGRRFFGLFLSIQRTSRTKFRDLLYRPPHHAPVESQGWGESAAERKF